MNQSINENTKNFTFFKTMFGAIWVSGKLPTYPSPKPTFCPKREVSVNVNLREG